MRRKLAMTQTNASRDAGFSVTEPTINKVPGVCGGAACVGKSRIPVWLLVAYQRDGWSEKQLLANYPTLSSEGLAAAWEYYRNNAAEIEAAIQANQNLE